MTRKVQSLDLRQASHSCSCTKHMQAPCTAGWKWGLSRRGRLLWLWPEFLPHFCLHCVLKLDGKDRLQSHVYKWVVIKRYLRMSMKSSFKSSANKVSFSSSGNIVSWDWSCSEEGRDGLWGHRGFSGVGAWSPFQPVYTGHTEGFCTTQHSCSPSPGHTWTHLSLEGFRLKMGQYHCWLSQYFLDLVKNLFIVVFVCHLEAVCDIIPWKSFVLTWLYTWQSSRVKTYYLRNPWYSLYSPTMPLKLITSPVLAHHVVNCLCLCHSAGWGNLDDLDILHWIPLHKPYLTIH